MGLRRKGRGAQHVGRGCRERNIFGGVAADAVLLVSDGSESYVQSTEPKVASSEQPKIVDEAVSSPLVKTAYVEAIWFAGANKKAIAKSTVLEQRATPPSTPSIP